MMRLPKKTLLGLAIGVVIVLIPVLQLVPLKQRLAILSKDLAAKQQQVTSLSAQNQELQQQLVAVDDKRKEVEERVSSLRNQLASTSEELGRLREVEVRSKALEGENARLELEINRISQERDAVQRRVARLQEDNADLEHSVARLRNRLSLLDRDYQHLADRLAQFEKPSLDVVPESAPPVESPTTPPARDSSLLTPGSESSHSSRSSPSLSAPSSQGPAEASPSSMSRGPSTAMEAQSIELPPIVVRKDEAGGMPIVRARLVEVNASHRFIVIDKGATDGVRVGMTFNLVRGGGTIGQAIAVRVRPQLAACDLVGSRTAGAPQVGDLAIQRRP